MHTMLAINIVEIVCLCEKNRINVLRRSENWRLFLLIRLAKNRALSSRQLNPQIISRDPSNNTVLSEGLVPSRSTMSPQSSPVVDVIQLRYVTCLAFLFYSYLIYSHSFFYLLGNITVSNFPHFSQMRTSCVQNCQTGQIGLCIS